MSDINSLFQNGAPMTASMYAGQNIRADQAQKAATLRQMQMQNDQNAILDPLKAQYQQGLLDQQKATLPGIVGQSQSAAAKGQLDMAGIADKIALEYSKRANEMTEEQMKSVAMTGSSFNQAHSIIASLHPSEQKRAYTQILQKQGVNPNDPMVKILMSLPDEQFAPSMQAMGQGMATASNKFIQDMAMKNAENESQERVAAGNRDSREEVARISAEARINAANVRSKAAMAGKNMKEQFVYLNAIPEEERTPAEQAEFSRLTQMMLAERTAGANATTPTVLGQQTPQQAAAATAAAIAGRVTPQNPAPGKINAPQSAAPDADLQALLKKFNMQYDPDYEYKVINGVPKRRRKQ